MLIGTREVGFKTAAKGTLAAIFFGVSIWTIWITSEEPKIPTNFDELTSKLSKKWIQEKSSDYQLSEHRFLLLRKDKSYPIGALRRVPDAANKGEWKGVVMVEYCSTDDLCVVGRGGMEEFISKPFYFFGDKSMIAQIRKDLEE